MNDEGSEGPGELGTVFIFELNDLEVIEISYTFALWNKTRRICQGVQERKAKRASIM
jgi:hypothetical protein